MDVLTLRVSGWVVVTLSYVKGQGHVLVSPISKLMLENIIPDFELYKVNSSL